MAGCAPGPRTTPTRAPSRKELAATTVLRLDLVAVSLKVRTGPPVDDEEDLALPYWAGVLPLVTMTSLPEPDCEAALPEHGAAYGQARNG